MLSLNYVTVDQLCYNIIYLRLAGNVIFYPLYLQIYSSLSAGEIQLIRQTLLIFFQDMHIRVSQTLQMLICLVTRNLLNNVFLMFTGFYIFKRQSAKLQRTLCTPHIRTSSMWHSHSRTYSVTFSCFSCLFSCQQRSVE